jgi:transposase
MPRKINQSERSTEGQNIKNKGNKTQEQSEYSAADLKQLLQIKTKLEKVEQDRLEWIYQHQNDKSNYTIRSIETLKNLEELPISAISPQFPPFAEGM